MEKWRWRRRQKAWPADPNKVRSCARRLSANLSQATPTISVLTTDFDNCAFGH